MVALSSSRPSLAIAVAAMALALSACSTNFGVDDDKVTPAEFQAEQVTMQAGIAAEKEALATLNPTLQKAVESWKSQPLKACSKDNLIAQDHSWLRRRYPETLGFDQRSIFERTSGLMTPEDGSAVYFLDGVNNPYINIKSLKLIEEIEETDRQGNRVKLQFLGSGDARQGTCVLMVGTQILYQTELSNALSATSLSRHQPERHVQGENDERPGTVVEIPVTTSGSIERNLFAYGAGLGVEIGAGAGREIFSASRAGEARRWILGQLIGADALEGSALESRVSVRSSPRAMGVLIAGTSMSSHLSLGARSLAFAVDRDPFQRPALNVGVVVPDAPFRIGYITNTANRRLMQYNLEFKPSRIDGSRVTGTYTIYGAKVVGMGLSTQTACLSEVVAKRSFVGSWDLSSLLSVCSFADVDQAQAVNQAGLVAQIVKLEDDRSISNRPSGVADAIARLVIQERGHLSLPSWWAGVERDSFKEGYKANQALMAHVNRFPIVRDHVREYIAKADVYRLPFDGKKLDRMVFITTNLEASGMNGRNLVDAFSFSTWETLTDEEVDIMRDTLRERNETDRISMVRDPRPHIESFRAQRREQERRDRVVQQSRDFETVLGSQSTLLQAALRGQDLISAYKNFAERRSLGQLASDHSNRVDEVVRILSKNRQPEDRWDAAATEIAELVKILINSNLSAADWAHLSGLLQAQKDRLVAYQDLRAAYYDLGVSVTREKALERSVNARELTLVRFLTPLASDLAARVAATKSDVYAAAQVYVEGGILSDLGRLPDVANLIEIMGTRVSRGLTIFARIRDREITPTGALELLEARGRIAELDERLTDTYKEQASSKPVLSVDVLRGAFTTSGGFDRLFVSTANFVEALKIQASSCAAIVTCQAGLHRALTASLSRFQNRAELLNLDLMSISDEVRRLIADDSELIAGAKLTNFQVLVNIARPSDHDFVPAMNRVHARLAGAANAALRQLLVSERANPPSGPVRKNIVLKVSEETMTSWESVLWRGSESSIADATAKAKAQFDALRKTTDAERIKKIEADLRAALGVSTAQ